MSRVEDLRSLVTGDTGVSKLYGSQESPFSWLYTGKDDTETYDFARIHIVDVDFADISSYSCVHTGIQTLW